MGTITSTIDDGVTAADIVVIYEGGPETLKYLFEVTDYDVVVTVEDPDTRAIRPIQNVPEHHPDVHRVTVTCIDKTGVTATLMEYKMQVQVRATIEAAAQGATYILEIERETFSNRRKGGIDRVWERNFFVRYMDG